MAAPTAKQLPKDGHVVLSMMKELGVKDYEPRVVNQLVEFAIRYVTCVLDDARTFANHAKKKTIDNEDVKLAVTMQLEKVFTTPPPRDMLLEVARAKNSQPLPLVKPHCGLRLPPDRYCFSSCNFRLKGNKKSSSDKKFSIGNSNSTLSGLKVTKNPLGLPTMKRSPNITNVARTQALTAVAKPVIKGPVIVNSQQNSQMVHAKPKIQVTAPTSQMEIKLEPPESCETSNGSGLKRKREDEDEIQ